MMKKNKKNVTLAVIKWISSVLPVFFWVFLIFGFEEPYMAFTSIAAALAHEAGHILYISRQLGGMKLRGVLSGFRIRGGVGMSYDGELKTYLSGPMANVLLFIAFSVIAPLFGGWAFDVAVINLATAVSNLMPIEGYDGYGIIRALLQRNGYYPRAEKILKGISTFLTFVFCIFSLYLIDRRGGGYWIFAVFFVSAVKCIKDDLGE